MLALPEEVLARPGIVEHITEVAGTHEAINPPGPLSRRTPPHAGIGNHRAVFRSCVSKAYGAARQEARLQEMPQEGKCG
jgi:hypothetical protein